MSVLAESPAGRLRRDVRVIGLVGAAHFVSHFFQLVLPPLFPELKEVFGVSYTALGVVMSVFYAASGVGQTVAGFLVDRFGARRVLQGGMAVLAGAVALAGFSPSYEALVAIALLAGLGNSVFHPADYSIFNATVDPARLGRAYSMHTVGGNLGWTASPLVIVGLGATLGWRGALVTAGALGLAATVAIASQGQALAGRAALSPRRPAGPGLGADLRLLMVAPILFAFAYFALLATALIGIQTFSVSAMVAIYEAPLERATGALTGFLLGSAGGVVAGGVLADRTSRHHLVAGGGLLAAATLSLAVASGAPSLLLLPVVMTVMGFCLGATSPSRDMLVRAATPVGASGKVFGFVYSGLDLGSSLTPLLFGWLLDRGEPRTIFVVVAAFMVVTIGTVAQVRRHARPAEGRA